MYLLIISMLILSNISLADESVCYFLKNGCPIKDNNTKDKKALKNDTIFIEKTEKEKIINTIDEVILLRSEDMGNTLYLNYGLRY